VFNNHCIEGDLYLIFNDSVLQYIVRIINDQNMNEKYKFKFIRRFNDNSIQTQQNDE
jgi:hypothetical protein